MALTTDHSETLQDRIRRDPAIRKHVLMGCVEHLILGEDTAAGSRLRDYVVGAVGFERLGAMTGESPQRLEQRFGAEGELRAGDLFETIVLLAHHEGAHLEMGAYIEEFGEESSRMRHVMRLFRKASAWWREYRGRWRRRRDMVLTADHRETAQDRIRRDPAIRKHVLMGCVEHLILGEDTAAGSRLRDYVVGAVGFERLGAMTGESLQRLEQRFGAEGELRAGNLFETIVLLAQHEGVHLEMGAYLEKFVEAGAPDA